MNTTIWQEWFGVSGGQTLMILLSVLCFYAAVVVLTRLVGLRSLSKMSASDFVMTVAVGSLFGAAIATPSPTVGMAAVALMALYAGQWLVGFARTRSQLACTLLDNSPVLLMLDGKPLYDNMRRTNVSEDDLRAKLREANALRYENVRAVVFECTGDVSVLHAQDGLVLEPDLLRGVQGALENEVLLTDTPNRLDNKPEKGGTHDR